MMRNKAARHVKLPEGWELRNNKKHLDVSEFYQITYLKYSFHKSKYAILLRDKDLNWLAHYQIDFDATTKLKSIYATIHAKIQETIQLIASSQRTWLKAEGFEFKDDCFYRIKIGDSPHVLTGLYDKPNNLFYVSELYEGGEPFSVPTIWVTAFKPADDSQESWDAVAKVKAWKGSTNDT